MFHLTAPHNPESACAGPETGAADPKALALIDAMTGCCHPRVSRLTERLLACGQPDQLRVLRGEVLNLLTLSFGHAEAQRRLQTPLQ
ncbi:MAG: hypothetical protein FWG56_12630 [Desulfovibrionaceae bacterium]|jgi:hypothetical protein|nr:hypothetical protein [Desulfovibrionaceae bacterium]